MKSNTFATILNAFAAIAFVDAQSQTSSSAPTSETAQPCSPLEIVVARGTTEPGKYGIVVGDPLVNATQALVKGATGYPVNYPASFAAGSMMAGIKDTVAHLNTQTKACPDQKFAMVGYSQGASVMHGAMPQVNSDLYSKIVALVMFGDPGNREQNQSSTVGTVSAGFPGELQNRLKENCQQGDPVCTNTGTDPTAHLTYGDPQKGYISASAEYIQKQFNSDGNSGPEPSPTDVGNGTNTCGLAALASLIGGPSSNSSCNGTSSSASAGASGTVRPSGSAAGSAGASRPTGGSGTQAASSSAAAATSTGGASSTLGTTVGSGVMALIFGALLQVL